VLIEHGGHGGSAAAPVAREVFEAWFRIQSPKPLLYPQRTAQLNPITSAENDV